MDPASMPTDSYPTYHAVAQFEHRFWLKVLGDHARFIRDAFSPIETKEIERTDTFLRVFDGLLSRANAPSLTDADWVRLSELGLADARRFREFKLHLLRRHLRGDIKLNLPPTFLNHMVNEIEEYLRLAPSLAAGEIPPPVHAVDHHLLWLLDTSEHTVFLDSAFDMVETDMHEKSRCFQHHFQNFYLKAVALAGYMRSRMTRFPALSRFHKQVELEIVLFQAFLREIEELQLNRATLDIISPLMPDHMAREECYYLIKLSQVSEVATPACNPSRTRPE